MRLKKRWLLLGMIILIMGYGFNKLILVDDDSLNNIPTSVSSAADTKSEHPLTPDYANFGVGDDMQTVLSSQGQPTHIEGNVWLYGESKVVFAQGKVIDWQSHAKDPLKTR